MRTLIAGLSVLAFLSGSCLTVGTGDGGGPALQRWILVEVVGDVLVDTGNPEVVAPRYRYRSLESFDVTGVMVVAGAAVSSTGSLAPGMTSRDAASAWAGEREAAIEHARADLLRRAGPCVRLVNDSASVAGRTFQERRGTITTAADVELDEPQIADLCRGGALP